MISFIWSLRGQRLGTTVKHESLFPWGSIALAVPTGLLSTLDGNNVILTPRSLDHRGKTPPAHIPFRTRWKRMIFGPHIWSGRKEKFSPIIRNGKVTFWSSCWQDCLYAERTTQHIIYFPWKWKIACMSLECHTERKGHFTRKTPEHCVPKLFFSVNFRI